jgi:translation initiation factor 2 subunit 3
MSTQMSNQMKNQPILNIGCLGSVSDGKSTTVLQLTGIKTQTHSNEKTRNITIKPGYANMKVWLNSNGEYTTTDSNIEEMDGAELVHHLSFVDCPGHQELILTMMGSVSLMKGAIVVVSAAEPIQNKPQLIQHLATAKIAGLEKLIVLFNKLDLVSKKIALERKYELDELLTKLEITPAYIIPTAMNKKIGLQNVIKAIMEVFPPEVLENKTETALFKLTRSFDINKPGIQWNEVKGGVLGGSLDTGKLNVGDVIEIRPGQWRKKDDSFIVVPIKTKVLELKSGKTSFETIYPGGLTALGTDIDPAHTKEDNLAGHIAGLVGTLPDVYSAITMTWTLTDKFDGNWSPKMKDKMYLQIGNINTEAELTDIKKEELTFKLSKPSCIENNSKILICSHEQNDILKIVGYGDFITIKSKKINI